MGLTGPSGVDELRDVACADADKVLESNTANDGTITLKCVDA